MHVAVHEEQELRGSFHGTGALFLKKQLMKASDAVIGTTTKQNAALCPQNLMLGCSFLLLSPLFVKHFLYEQQWQQIY